MTLKLTGSTGASFNRGRSNQDRETPNDFIKAVEQRFGPIEYDLAADALNAQSTRYFSEQDDALVQDWHHIAGLLWLNPSFARIKPWVKKCQLEARKGARIVLLVPGSIGTEWFANHVHGHAMVLGLRPRLSFDGVNPYPKDLMLAVYGPSDAPGFGLWKWKTT